MKPLKVEMLGTRGLPNRYGGSETCIEEVGIRLLERGHQVRVYCRPSNTGTRAREYRGMELVPMPSIPVQQVDTLSHSVLGILRVAWRRRREPEFVHVLHFHGSGNGAVGPLTRLLRLPTVITVDGPDWRRQKWGPFAKKLLYRAAWMATRFMDVVVADARTAQQVYLEDFGAKTRYSPYGAPEVPEEMPPFPDVLSERGVQPGQYVTFVGRFTPEKEIHTLIRAHATLPADSRPALVLVGGKPGDSEYADELGKIAGDAPDVHFMGKVYGDTLPPIVRHSGVYVQASEVEGTAPVLLEAMSYGLPLITSDIRENQEAVGPDGNYFPVFDVDALAAKIAEVFEDRDAALARAEILKRRVHEVYNWEKVTDDYISAYEEALRVRASHRG